MLSGSGSGSGSSYSGFSFWFRFLSVSSVFLVFSVMLSSSFVYSVDLEDMYVDLVSFVFLVSFWFLVLV